MIILNPVAPSLTHWIKNHEWNIGQMNDGWRHFYARRRKLGLQPFDDNFRVIGSWLILSSSYDRMATFLQLWNWANSRIPLYVNSLFLVVWCKLVLCFRRWFQPNEKKTSEIRIRTSDNRNLNWVYTSIINFCRGGGGEDGNVRSYMSGFLSQLKICRYGYIFKSIPKGLVNAKGAGGGVPVQKIFSWFCHMF